MSLLRQLRFRIRALAERERLERELDEELRFHLAAQEQENLRHGMSPEAARRAARESLGGLETVKEECRESWGVRLVDTLLWDSRIGVRGLIRNPAYTAVAAVTLALGIGANTAVFSVVNGVLLKPLPYREDDRLMLVQQRAPGARIESLSFSVAEIEAYRERSRTLEGVVEYHELWFTLLGDGEPERVKTGIVSANFFDVLGIEPLHGRAFIPADDLPGAEPALVLSHDYWQRRHGGDPRVVGRTFEMNDRVHTVVGVLPPVPQYPRDDDVYMPVSACPFRSSRNTVENPAVRMVPLVFCRVRHGVSRERAAADLSRVAEQLRSQHPQAYPAQAGFALALAPIRGELTRAARPLLLLLLATAGLVLLNASANVANIALARLLRRERELAVRRALGATRRRLLRQLLTESALLAVLGGALGLLLAFVGLDALVAFAGRFTPRASEVSIDGTVLLFTLAISLVTGIAFGSLPAVPWREHLGAVLAGSGLGAEPGRRRLQRGLIVAQLAVSFVLLIGAGLMTRKLFHLHQVDAGFQHENVLAVDVDLDFTEYPGLHGVVERFYDPLLDRLHALPGVHAAAVAQTFPLNDTELWLGWFETEQARVPPGGLRRRAELRVASPRYFDTVGIPVIAGRSFCPRDDADAPGVAIVNQSFALHHFGERDPIGGRITMDRGESWREIVGVVGDVRQRLDQRAADELYLPYAQSPTWQASVLLRADGDPDALAEQVRAAVYRIDPEQPVADVRTLSEVRQVSLAPPRLTALLLGLFAALALAITATGIGGSIAFAVTQRRQELGIRMALGADRTRVLALVLREGATLVALGLGLGLAGAYTLAWLLAGQLGSSTRPDDPLTFVLVSLLLVGVAGLACLMPARRAAAIDPMTAVRSG